VTEVTSRLILLGGFHEMVELCEALGKEIVGIIDPQLQGEYLGYKILGRDEDAPRVFQRFGTVPVVATPDSPAIREKLHSFYGQIGFRWCELIHPSAVVSRTAKIGSGVVIALGANVSSMAEIGDQVKINVRANVMHDVKVGPFTTIAPNAVVLGRVQIGRGCYIGANATILPGVQLGEGAVVGAGAVVTRPVEDHAVVKGNPARQGSGAGGEARSG
jgi:sugar O-acyltransferase (sialic acid O-acetyltransferase NeuD family)